MTESTDLTRYEPRDLTALLDYAEMICGSALLPKHIKTAADAVLIVQRGRELGLTSMTSLQHLYIIDGKVSLPSAIKMGCALASPLCEYFRCIETTPTQATYETQRRGYPEPDRLTYTLAQAKTAGLTGKTNWRNHPAEMLRARASSQLATMVYPDILAGVYTPEEIAESAPRVVSATVVDSTPEPEQTPSPPPASDEKAAEARKWALPVNAWKRELVKHLRRGGVSIDDQKGYFAAIGGDDLDAIGRGAALAPLVEMTAEQVAEHVADLVPRVTEAEIVEDEDDPEGVPVSFAEVLGEILEDTPPRLRAHYERCLPHIYDVDTLDEIPIDKRAGILSVIIDAEDRGALMQNVVNQADSLVDEATYTKAINGADVDLATLNAATRCAIIEMRQEEG